MERLFGKRHFDIPGNYNLCNIQDFICSYQANPYLMRKQRK